MRVGLKGTETPCHCVFRAIFRACYARFRECVETEKRFSTVSLEWCGGVDNRRCYGRKVEEYAADFLSVTRHALNDADYRIFRFHYVLGADWMLCCSRLNLDRGLFFHTIYRVQRVLGRTYREMQPYSLFPLDEYFGGAIRPEDQEEERAVPEAPLAFRRRIHSSYSVLQRIA